MAWIIFQIIVWVLICATVGAWHHSRGGNGYGTFVLSLFLSPLMGLLVVAGDGVDQDELDDRMIKKGWRKRCPLCRSVVRPEALVCPHCRVQFERFKQQAGG